MESKKRRRIVVPLVVLVVILLCSNACMLYYSGIPARALGGLGRALGRAEGIQFLLSELGIEAPTPRSAARQWIERGAELEQEELYASALEAYQKALELAPDEAVVHVALASAYEGLDEPGKALDHLKEAAELEPDNPAVQRFLGRMQCIQGRFEPCIAALEKAVGAEPDEVLGRIWLAMAYEQSAGDNFEKALAQYQDALEIDPDFPGTYLSLGRLYLTQPGREILALEAFQDALAAALDTDDEEMAAQAREELAELYYARDSFTQCLDTATQILSEQPENGAAHRRLGLCYAMRGREGDLELAIEALEQALSLNFGQLDLYYLYLGDYRAAQGDADEAVWAWKQFLRFSKDEDMMAEVQDRIEEYSQ